MLGGSIKVACDTTIGWSHLSPIATSRMAQCPLLCKTMKGIIHPFQASFSLCKIHSPSRWFTSKNSRWLPQIIIRRRDC